MHLDTTKLPASGTLTLILELEVWNEETALGEADSSTDHYTEN
jgi:hypothetical protein